MLIYINADGSFTNVQPSTITQGSNNIQEIIALAEGVSQSSAINISFELPNGQVINGGLMIPQDDMVINNEVITSWRFTVTKNVTNFPGTLKIHMVITDANGGELGTYIASVVITKGLQPILPSVPTTDWYDEIKTAYAYITGKISTLELGKVKKVRLQASDFTLNSTTGLYEATVPLTDLAMVNDGNYIVQGFYDDGTVYRSVGLDFSYNKTTYEFTIYAEQAEDYDVVIASRVEANEKSVLTLTNPSSLVIDYEAVGAVEITNTVENASYTLPTPDNPALCYRIMIISSSDSTEDFTVENTTITAGGGIEFYYANGVWYKSKEYTPIIV